MPRRLLVSLVLLLALLVPARSSAEGLSVGFADPILTSSDAATRDFWLDRAAETKASIIRVDVHWADVAPRQPGAGFLASDPGSPEYHWSSLDATVRDATARGLRILFTVYDAPTWAEGPGRPKKAEPGSWEPVANAYGEFAEALAGRYDGAYPDPLGGGAPLPAVHYFEAWNEPNLSTYLTPQWRGAENSGPVIYRALLDRFYSAIKSVQPSALVVAGSLAPFGDEPGGARTRPVLFTRALLCLQGGALAPLPCPEKARFDVLSDHPIAVGNPTRSAVSPLDVTTPDIGRLTRILRKAEAAHLALPATPKPIWVTEFWYDTDPPDPGGVSLETQARWYEQDLYLFWKQGVNVAIALQLRDAPEGKGYAYTSQSGVYFLDGSPKPSQTALRFPLIAHRTGPFKVEVWGIAPRPGPVKIEAQRKGGWKTLATVRAGGPGMPFQATVKLLRYANLRATIGGEPSLTWSQR
ncbi:MAG TPA: hypothetical protein VIJ21_10020 [Solirubrobacterales bacterium]